MYEFVPRGALVAKASFDELCRAEYRSLVALALVFAPNRTQAEELVQETFEAALRRWSTISGYDEPAGWLRRVLVNRCRSRWRRHGRESTANARHHQRPRPGGGEPSVPDPELAAAIQRLPNRQAQVVALHYVQDLTIDAVATALGVSPSTTRTHLQRALGTLRRELGCDRSQDDD